MCRIFIIDDSAAYWVRGWVTEGEPVHPVLTTEMHGARQFTRQEAEDYKRQLETLGYNVHIDGGL